jgi:uncharacterized protein (TIGR03437 family)
MTVMHQDGSAVSSASPVVAGETLTVYATGLGAVNGTLAIGFAPADTTSTTTVTPQISLGNHALTVTYSGLLPGSVGIYQVSAVAPSTLAAGTPVLTFALTDAGQTATWIAQ